MLSLSACVLSHLNVVMVQCACQSVIRYLGNKVCVSFSLQCRDALKCLLGMYVTTLSPFLEFASTVSLKLPLFTLP